MTIRGKTKEVALTYWVSKVKKGTDGKNRIALVAEGSFNRENFGITYNRKLMGRKKLIGKNVELQIEFVGVQTEK